MDSSLRPSPNPVRAADVWNQALNPPENGGNNAPGKVDSHAIQRPSGGELASIPSPARLENKFSTDTVASPRDISIALNYGLELVRYGAMLVIGEGRIRFANRSALAILSKQDGLSITPAGIVADRASDTRLLLKLLRDAIEFPEQGEPKDSPFTVLRKNARSSLVVRVVPGPGLDCWPTAEHRPALVMIYDQDIGFDVNIPMLSKLYGLTRGEAVLAASLMRGKSIEEAADELFISPHTARTHLKRIFMKTDTHRQTELVIRIFPAIL